MSNKTVVNHLKTVVSMEGEGAFVASGRRLQAQQDRVSTGNREMAASALKSAAAERKRRAAFKGGTGALREMSKAATSLVGVALKLERRLERVEALTRRTQRQMSGLRGMIRRTRAAIGRFSTKWTELNSKLEVGRKVIAGTSAAFKALLGKPALLAVDFETGLARIRTLGRDTAGELEEGLASLAKRVPQNIVDVTRAAYSAISAQAGRSNRQILTLLDAASKVATGAGTTLEVAVDGLTAATNSYAASNLSAAQAADTMFATMRVGKIKSLDEMVESMGKGLSTAALAKTQFEEVGAAIATMTARGVSTAEAFTRVEQVIKNLAKPTRQQRAAFGAYNLGVGIANLQTTGFTNKLQELVKVTGATGEALSLLSGRNTESFQGLALLLGDDGGELYRRNLAAIRADAGAAARAFSELDNTTSGAFARLKSEFEATLVDIGKVLLPEVNRGIALLRGYIKSLTPDDIQQIANELRRIAAMIVDVGGSLLRTLSAAAPMLERLVNLIVGLGRSAGFALNTMARLMTSSEQAFDRIGQGARRAYALIREDKGVNEASAAVEQLRDATDRLGNALNRQSTPFLAYDQRIERAINQARALSGAQIEAANTGRALTLAARALAGHLPGVELAAGAVAMELGNISVQGRATIGVIDEMTLALGRQLQVLGAFPGAAIAMRTAVEQALEASRRSEAQRRRRLPGRRGPRRPNFGRRRQRGPTSVTASADEQAFSGQSDPLGFLRGAADAAQSMADPIAQAVDRSIERFRSFAAEAKASLDQVKHAGSAFGQSVFASFTQATVGALLYQRSMAGVANAVIRSLAEQGLGLSIQNVGWALQNEAKFSSTLWPGFKIAAGKHWSAAGWFGLIGGGAALLGSQTGAFSSGSGGGGAGGGGGLATDRAPSARELGQQPRDNGPLRVAVVFDFAGASRTSLWDRAVVHSLNRAGRHRGIQRVDRRVIGRS